MLSYLIVDPDPETRMDPTPTRDVGIGFGIDLKNSSQNWVISLEKLLVFGSHQNAFSNPDSDPETRSGIPRIRIYPTDFFSMFG